VKHFTAGRPGLSSQIPRRAIANPHLNDDIGTIITFPGKTFGPGNSFALLKGPSATDFAPV